MVHVHIRSGDHSGGRVGVGDELGGKSGRDGESVVGLGDVGSPINLEWRFPRSE